MFFWFLGTAIVAVWYVFRDARFDYRLLCLGALVPDLIDVWFGGAWAFHSVVVSVAVLLAVVLASAGRKRWRKRALAIPIGMMLHLVFDGAFTNTEVFWWPLTGWSFPDEPLPSAARGWWNVPLEIAGLAILAWTWRTCGLRSPARRTELWSTGVLRPAAPASGRTSESPR